MYSHTSNVDNKNIISFAEKSKKIAIDNLRESLISALNANINKDEIKSITVSICEKLDKSEELAK